MDRGNPDRWTYGLAVATVAVFFLSAAAFAGVTPATYYSETSAAPAQEIALSHLRAAATELDLTASDVADVAVTDLVPSGHNGVTHVYLRQRVNGLEIDGAEMGIHIDRQGRIFHRTGGFVRAAGNRASAVPQFPALSPDMAVRAAARTLGLRAAEADLAIVESVGGFDHRVVFSSPELSEEEIPVRLRYFRTSGSDRLTLAWNLNLKVTGAADWFDMWLDATTGDVVGKVNWTAEVDATYTVFASPKESPWDGARTAEVDPYIAGGTSPATGASPYGWHDLNGVLGGETALTSGNNVNACTDTDANNACDVGSQPSGGTLPAALVFDPALDLATQQPADYRDAAVVNLYYWNNIIHDISYQYGFNEVAGNFQQNNYLRGGLGNDSVNADAQDGSGLNNANFGTPPDGSKPRMQMFVWTNPFGQLVKVLSPGGIAGDYVANPSNNGGLYAGAPADLALVIDGTPPTDDACQTVTNNLTGKIALIVWSGGLCNSSVFVTNAANAGAIAAIIVDETLEPLTNFGGSALIPSVAVGSADGQLFITNIAAPVNADIEDNPAGQINRDSDIDAGVIVHEYGHGISNRLTGGPATASCLGNQEQMGEGWSDWQTLFLHAALGDTATTPRPIGTYVTFENGATGFGIRSFPYNTDNLANPLTYIDIATESVPHGVGAIWANMLWEMYWNLVGEFGYDPDLYAGTGGNNLAYQLVTDGMKLQPCSPGFVTGRNAILAADQANYDGDLACPIWTAFAERGVGFGASQGSSGVVGDETESFVLPSECVDLIFADSFGFGTDRWSSVAP